MVDRSQLRQFMVESFNEDELADLVFDYFPNVRPLLGETMTLSQKVRVLIDFADRHGRTDHLVVTLEKLRPEAYCEFFQTDLELPPEPETARRDPNKIFISYANPDAEFATRLAASLREGGFDVWMAPDSILPGEKWVAAIERGLRECGIFLLIMSPEGVESKWVSQETQVAIMLENEGKMRIYPLRVRRAEVPLLLSTRQHISFEADFDRGLRALMAVLRPAKVAPAAAPVPPPATPAITSTLVVGDELPVLIIDWPNAPNQEVTLSRASYSIGRAPDNDVVLALPIVSSHHLRVETIILPEGFQVQVVDLGSRNGTFVSGRRLAPNVPHTLDPGDVINLGDRVGRSISLILRPDAFIIGGGPPPDAGEARGDAPVAAAVAPAPPARAAQPLPPAPTPLSRVPKWAYAVAGGAVLLLLALLLLRPGGDDTPSVAATLPATEAAFSGLPAATEAGEVAAPTDAPAETLAAATPTDPPPTAAPTDAPDTAVAAAASPTADATPTAEPTAAPTAEPTAAPTEEPTAAPVTLPTEAPNFALSRAAPLGFEAAGEWLRDAAISRGTGEISISSEQARSGQHALRLGYELATSGDDYVAFLAPRGYRIDNDRERRILKLWVLGDGAPLNLSAIVRDDLGEQWQVFLGEVRGTEWQQVDGFIGDTTWPSGILRNRGNGEVDFPVRLLGFLLDDATPSFSGSGAIFIDDVTAE